MVPLSIVSKKVVYSSCLVVMTQYGSLQIFSYYLPVWFQTILGVGPIQSGADFMATAGILMAVSFTAGLVCKFSPITPFPISHTNIRANVQNSR